MFLFTDNNISYYYEKKGKYDFGYEFPKMLASSIICTVLNLGIKLLIYNQKRVQKIKELNFYGQDKNLINNNIEKFFSIYYLKIKIFTVISSILLLFFFFYIISFGSIFNQSQGYFCIRVVLSFIVSMIYPFIISLISAFLRIYGIRYNKKCIYDSSLFIQYL